MAQPRAWQSTSEREARAPEPERSSSSAGLADAALASPLVQDVHALAEQAQGFQNRESEKMAEQREAMRLFEARQEMQMQTQMQTMMAHMWHHLTSQAGISQVQQHQEVQQQPEAQPHLLPELDDSWEMEADGDGETSPPRQP